ncbi:hypothetical protein K2Z84_13450 [Candidatus Binatia bacterium]|nr:hypothetical protein [Candidatus Binatia bacterium]
MKTILKLLVAGILSTSMPSAALAEAVPARILNDVGGTVHIHQQVPCGDPVSVDTSVAQGRMEITPRITRDAVFFDLTRLDMFVTPFSVERSCGGIRAAASFSEIGVRLAGAVRFAGKLVPSTNGAQIYRFVIPRKNVLIYESVLDNLTRRRPEIAYQRPSRHVTGIVEVVTTDRGMTIKSVQLRVALHTKLHFQAGCVTGGACAIDKVEVGNQIAHVVASVRPSATGLPD